MVILKEIRRKLWAFVKEGKLQARETAQERK